jgi:DNA-binding response OmpR family regulator
MVMVVEDHDETRTALLRLLRLSGIDAVGAADGEVARDLLKDVTPELVLLDYMMPRLDGAGLLRIMQGDPRLAGVPVVLCTAYSTTRAFDGLKVAEVLPKPFSWDKLLDAIHKHKKSA